MNMNEAEALKWFVIAIGSVTSVAAAATWIMLIRLRTKVHRLREERKRNNSASLRHSNAVGEARG